MKKLLVLALGFALMACTNPMTAKEEVPAVENEINMSKNICGQNYQKEVISCLIVFIYD